MGTTTNTLETVWGRDQNLLFAGWIWELIPATVSRWKLKMMKAKKLWYRKRHNQDYYLFRRLVVRHRWTTVYCHLWYHQEYQTTSSINHQFINRWPFAAADHDISHSACIILSSESISRLVSSALSFVISFLLYSFSVAWSLLSIITELTILSLRIGYLTFF